MYINYYLYRLNIFNPVTAIVLYKIIKFYFDLPQTFLQLKKQCYIKYLFIILYVYYLYYFIITQNTFFA